MVKKIVSIVGLTSSGKSGLALELAKFFDAEIVSADSRQIYRGMNWCTGKETPEELSLVPHHLIDILNPGELYNLAEYQKDAYQAIDGILARGKLPILVGGTGLYVRSVVDGYNLSEAAVDQTRREQLNGLSRDKLLEKLKQLGITNVDTQKSNRHLVRLIEKAEVGDAQEKAHKPKYDVLQLAIKWTREEIYDRIEKRLDDRLPHILTEVKQLVDDGVSREFMFRMGLEAKMATEYLDGKFDSYDHFRNELLKEERHFAKRQDTWFKKDTNTIWIDGHDNCFERAKELIEKFLEK
ncbi:MAG: tRNA (adenosine(37)-N6)-dimethylallyltransferase MiaA [Clostridia bacterium]|nr:tRNA (adenosine(37)-N6)-dimethylallyltransferase MiaA [Clostridia bacterium]